MKWIDKLGRALNQNFHAKSVNVFITVGISVLYMCLLDLLFNSTIYIYHLLDKNAPSGQIGCLFKLVSIILSPISLANYYYNRSKFEEAEVGKIRTIIILLCTAFLCFSSIGLLYESIITHSFFYSCIQNFLTKFLVCILGICLFFIIRPEVIIKLKPKTSLILYLTAHLFWISNMFVIISYMRVSGSYERVFNKIGFIIIAILIFVAVTYSLTQQYFYKRLTKLQAAE